MSAWNALRGFVEGHRLVIAVALIGLVALFCLSAARPVSTRRTLVVATTTSLYDTGLLDYLRDYYGDKYGVDLYFIPVGTELAFQHAMRGDADAVLAHSPSEELGFMREGFGVNRRVVAYNFFTIVGPPSDPAKIKGLAPLEALRKIAEAGGEGKALWVSRGDGSGTHVKERELWRELGSDPASLAEESWYIEAGAGMGKTLLLANEKEAYTLSDAGTYLKYLKEGRVRLVALVSKGKELINVYSAIAVNPNKVKGVNFEGAMAFINFLTSQEGQALIEEYGERQYGLPLFYSAVEAIESSAEVASWIKECAFLEGYECPPKYRLEPASSSELR